MAQDRYEGRRKKLAQRLRAVGAEAFLVTSEVNVRYLTGFTGDSSWLLLSKQNCLFVSDTRYTTQLAEECPEIETHIRDARLQLHQAAGKVINASRVKSLAFEAGRMTVRELELLKSETKNCEFVGTDNVIETLRMVKDASEIKAIREAVHLAQRGYEALKASLVQNMTELNASHLLEHSMRGFGAEGAAFEIIVAAGPRAALPHARPTEASIATGGMLLIDWGAQQAGGYKSDLTRVLATANISPKLQKVHRVVFEAQQRAIAAIGPGVRCQEIDSVARSYIANAGYEKQFGHGLGHGFGLEIHEYPRLSPISEDTLKPGMVVTVEPGVYIPGWGGVRIEDDVLVTRNGCEVLSSLPKEIELTDLL